MSKGQKICPSCNKIVGCRTLICLCKHDFGIKKKEHSQDIPPTTQKITKNKTPNKNRRTKRCPNCKKEWGFKKRTCKCGWEFPSNKVYKEWVIDWTTLKVGDIVRSISGHGPYWLIRDTEDILEIQRMGSYGIFKVIKLEESGILVRPIAKNKCGVEFLYMGEDKLGKTGMYMVAHKLQLIQKTKKE